MADTSTASDARPEPGADSLEEFKELFAEQRERQGLLRHVQQFLKSPLFIDLRDAPITVSDPPEAIAERKAEVDHRIRVIQSLLTLLQEEREALERMQSIADGPAPPAASGDAVQDGSGYGARDDAKDGLQGEAPGAATEGS